MKKRLQTTIVILIMLGLIILSSSLINNTTINFMIGMAIGMPGGLIILSIYF